MCKYRVRRWGGNPSTRENGPRFSKLTINAVRYLYRHLSSGTLLVFPESSGAVFLIDLYAKATDTCEDCGYSVPVGCPEPSAVPPRPRFERFRQSRIRRLTNPVL